MRAADRHVEVGDLQAHDFQHASGISEVRTHPLWVDSLDARGTDFSTRPLAEALAGVTRIARPATFDPRVALEELRAILGDRGLSRARIGIEEAQALEEAERLAGSLGLTFIASGAASEPGLSLARKRADSPWSLCRRPWTVMYFTANGRALPCCIAPFSQHGYENYTLGDATQESLREIWNGARYRSFREALLSDAPPSVAV